MTIIFGLGLIGAASISGEANAASFSICGDWGGECQTDRATWQDLRVTYNRENGKPVGKKVPYDGIIISSFDGEYNVALYLKGYKGPGTYTIKGAKGGYNHKSHIQVKNVNYSHDSLRYPHWVSYESPGNSSVTITKDANGLFSGHYDVKVHYNGEQDQESYQIKGEFSDISKENPKVRTFD